MTLPIILWIKSSMKIPLLNGTSNPLLYTHNILPVISTFMFNIIENKYYFYYRSYLQIRGQNGYNKKQLTIWQIIGLAPSLIVVAVYFANCFTNNNFQFCYFISLPFLLLYARLCQFEYHDRSILNIYTP